MWATQSYYIETSSTVYINTGAPQACVLSAYLFTLYTNEMSHHSSYCKIIKYADDTVITRLINNEDERQYREIINWATQWCTNNYLELNVSKTEEMIFDFRE